MLSFHFPFSRVHIDRFVLDLAVNLWCLIVYMSRFCLHTLKFGEIWDIHFLFRVVSIIA